MNLKRNVHNRSTKDYIFSINSEDPRASSDVDDDEESSPEVDCTGLTAAQCRREEMRKMAEEMRRQREEEIEQEA